MAAVILTVITIAVILALNRGKNKIPAKLAVCIVGLEIVGTVISLSGGSGTLNISQIKRPEAGGSSEEHEVIVRQGDREEKVTLNIPARKLTDREAERAVKAAEKQIKKEYLGKNKKANSVYKDLKLRSRYNGNVSTDWEITPYDIFDSEGKIDNSKAEKETDVCIKGYLDCQGKTGKVEMQITVIPIPVDTAEGFSYYLRKAVTEANEKDPTADYVKLPEKVGGKSLVFSEKKEDDGIKLVIMMTLLPGLYVFYMRQKAKDDEKKWQQELSYDYPKMLSQLSLYIGAGFSVKAAFVQVGNAYIKRRSRGHPERPAFEAIVRMNRMIKDGEDEERAYRNLGESLRHKGFRKLTLLLSQSLKKGGKDLRDQLEQEERSAYDERRINAKVAGEEASLKLLIPMMGLLGVIFIVLMVPAFMQMS
ncbi:MAG: type II secretion system F family protein [Lachnospiraceae bacterium]|nr:type II secretion system F family protein [Lachnospiraceae bacterium]